MFGGAEIYIKGEGMAIEAPSNFPFYTVTSFNDVQGGQIIKGKNLLFLRFCEAQIKFTLQ